MIPFSVYPDVEVQFGLDPDKPQLLEGVRFEGMGLLRHGTESGKAVVMMLFILPDGTQVVAQTTWALFHSGAKALAVTPIAREETTFDRPDRG